MRRSILYVRRRGGGSMFRAGRPGRGQDDDRAQRRRQGDRRLQVQGSPRPDQERHVDQDDCHHRRRRQGRRLGRRRPARQRRPADRRGRLPTPTSSSVPAPTAAGSNSTSGRPWTSSRSTPTPGTKTPAPRRSTSCTPPTARTPSSTPSPSGASTRRPSAGSCSPPSTPAPRPATPAVSTASAPRTRPTRRWATYRYVMIDTNKTESDDDFGNTFFSRIDVVTAK